MFIECKVFNLSTTKTYPQQGGAMFLTENGATRTSAGGEPSVRVAVPVEGIEPSDPVFFDSPCGGSLGSSPRYWQILLVSTPYVEPSPSGWRNVLVTDS